MIVVLSSDLGLEKIDDQPARKSFFQYDDGLGWGWVGVRVGVRVRVFRVRVNSFFAFFRMHERPTTFPFISKTGFNLPFFLPVSIRIRTLVCVY